MKIVIITDGNNTLGMGHVYQSMTLADSILKRTNKNTEIIFLTKSNSDIIELLKKTKCPVSGYLNDELIFNALTTIQPDHIIFDKLDVSPELAKKIKECLKAKLTIFTNLTEANNFADITVLADIGSDFQNIYKKNEVTGQINFFGPKYWILRPEFYEYKKKTVSLKAIKNIMLIFGGADPCNISSGVLNELLKQKISLNITLVLGAAFEHHKELQVILQNNYSSLSTVKVTEKITNVAEVMSRSDLVFASPGLSFFEALAVGTPAICFHQNELQKNVYGGFIATYDVTEIYKTGSLIETKSFVYPTDPFISSMQIGEGKEEILNEIFK